MSKDRICIHPPTASGLFFVYRDDTIFTVLAGPFNELQLAIDWGNQSGIPWSETNPYPGYAPKECTMNDNIMVHAALRNILTNERIDLMEARVEDKIITVEPWAGGLIVRILAAAEYLAFRAKQEGIDGGRSWTINVNGVTVNPEPDAQQFAILENLQHVAANQLDAKLSGAIADNIVQARADAYWTGRWREALAEAERKRDEEEQRRIKDDPKYAAQKAADAIDRENAIKAEQDTADNLLLELTKISLIDEGALLGWLVKFAPVNDSIHVQYDRNLLASVLEQRGYKEHDCVVEQGEAFDPEDTARWIFGQAIAQLRGNNSFGPMPIHPILADKAQAEIERRRLR